LTVELAPVVERRLGALPAPPLFLRRLDVAGIIDELCPIREVAHLTHGQVIEVLVANRLSSPTSMVRVRDWARTWAVEEVFGVEPDLLNDDRLARALDAIAPHLEEITGSVGAQAIAEFGIDTAQIHWDMTSMSLFGAYEDQEEGFPQVRYGHPKDRRVDLKQIQAGLAVTRDGGIPLFHRVYDGGAGEVAQVVGAMNALRKTAERKDFLLVADSKLVSHPNITALLDAKVDFIAPLPAAQVKADVYAALDLHSARPVDYVNDRDRERNTPADQRESYRVLEDVHVMTGPRKSDPQHRLRRILVHSTGNAKGQQAARAKRLARAAEDLEKLQRSAGGRFYNTAAKVEARIGVIAKTRRVASCLRTGVTVDSDGRPSLAWHFDQDILDTEAAADGWYALVTRLTPEQADAAEVLKRYKGQGVVERRYNDFKGPLAVAPIFLEHNRRIAALITVICLALLVFCLIERQVRQALGPDRTMGGLYPDNRKVRPTGRMILYHLDSLMLRPGTATSPPVILINRGVQAHLLELLGIDETRPRWLET
ncbi:IS1634 family transposase, partial [Streptomyces sp. CB01881]|uniref:IS1634 family transposase n=1 Tax=Streptomyces sp. CB01881 TaxID=2078691 RepID=UPI001883252A